MRAQRRTVDARAHSRHHIRHQPLAAGLVLARDDRGLRHILVAHQRRLDLAWLDADAAQLHLRVRAPKEVEHPVNAPARDIAGAVHAAARRPERIGHEPFRRQCCAPEVTACEPSARDVKLARDTRRHRLQAGVQDISAIVGQRAPDRHVQARFLVDDRKADCVDRGFGRAVKVGDARDVEMARDQPLQVHRERLAAQDQMVQ